jgi:hypothetical protein
MQKQVEIAGSEVWSMSRIVATFTAVISLPLLPVFLVNFWTSLVVIPGGDLHSLTIRDTIFFTEAGQLFVRHHVCFCE